ncbi:MAG: hypothetical protein NVSMB44_19990 [Ktedonobacteraceae bacterium]
MTVTKIDTIQLENALRGLKYPVTRDKLISHVEEQDLEEQIRAAIHELPNHHYRSAGEVTKAIGALGNATREN